jgi:hypothetical protein
MTYFTYLQFGDSHEPKTLIFAKHSFNIDDKGRHIVNIFDYQVEQQETVNGDFKPVKNWSEEAVKVSVKAHLFRFGIDNDKTEKL